MEDNRKKWIPPQLIVLGRGTPEENVLAGCKTSKLTGATATKVSCKKVIDKCHHIVNVKRCHHIVNGSRALQTSSARR